MGADEGAPVNATDVLSLLVPVTYFLLLVTERMWPALPM
jgi:hypothetical protein